MYITSMLTVLLQTKSRNMGVDIRSNVWKLPTLIPMGMTDLTCLSITQSRGDKRYFFGQARDKTCKRTPTVDLVFGQYLSKRLLYMTSIVEMLILCHPFPLVQVDYSARSFLDCLERGNTVHPEMFYLLAYYYVTWPARITSSARLRLHQAITKK